MTEATIAKQQNSKRDYSKIEILFAWFCLFAGYLFCKSFPAFFYPLGAFLFIITLFLATTVVLLVKKFRFTFFSAIISLSALLVSSALLLTSNGFIHFFAFSYAIMAYFYFVYITGGNCIDKTISDYIFADFFKAVIIMPFRSFGNLFVALWPKKKNGRTGNVFLFILKVLLGIVIAVIPTAIVMSLLSYDYDFIVLLRKVFGLDFASIASNIYSLIYGIPFGALIYGIFISSADNKCKKFLNKDSCQDLSEACKFVPSATAIAAVLPVLAVYVVFFISQWEYYISAFTGKLPESFSYAEYAREGFFQLCVVSLINLAIIIALGVFMKRVSKLDSILLRIVSSVYSVFTLALISTAVSKMVLYIENKGFTPKRVYATWFMIVIAVIFVAVILKQIIPSFKVVFASALISVFMFGMLGVANPDNIIAKYNVTWCLDGKFDTEDISSVQDLGYSAVPYLVDVYNETGEFKEFLSDKKAELDEMGVFEYNLPKLKAKAELQNLKLD